MAGEKTDDKQWTPHRMIRYRASTTITGVVRYAVADRVPSHGRIDKGLDNVSGTDTGKLVVH
jgi:hypothetical protein